VKNARLKVKGILLDLDGTIVDSREAYSEAMKIALEKMGQKATDNKKVTEIPKRLEQGLPIDDVINGANVKEFLAFYLKAYYEATITKAKPMPCIKETLENLSRKAKLAVVTMRHVPKSKVVEELDRFGLAEYISNVVTALDTRYPKPSPEALMKCSNQMGLETYECAIVGDSIVDVRAGKAAGAKTVAVLSGIFTRRELETEKPDLILENVKKLPYFVE
jgi:HAD superfamily hydrolase (TIGR01509 family)